MLPKLRVLGVRRRAEAGEDNGNAASYGLAAIKGRFAGHKKPLNGLGVCSTARLPGDDGSTVEKYLRGCSLADDRD